MSHMLFSACILSIFAITAAIRIYKGIRGGFMKMLIVLSLEILCVVTSMILSPIFGRWGSNLIDLYRFSSYLGTMNPQKAQIIRACIAMVLSILLFLVLYIITRLIAALFMHHLTRTRLKASQATPKYTAEGQSWIARNDKVLGGITGLCCAIITTMVLTSPLMGVADIAGRACDMAETAKENLNLVITVEDELKDIKKYSQNIPGNIFYQFGGKHMIGTVAQGKIDKKAVYFFHEVEAIEETMENLFAVLPVLKNPAKVQPSDLEHLDALCNSIEDLQLCHLFLPNFISQGSNAWLQGKSYWGIRPPATNEMIKPLWSEVLRTCKNTTLSTAKEDLTTLLRVYQIFLQNEIFSWNMADQEATLAQLAKGDLISQLERQLSQNLQMKHIANDAPTIALHILAELIFKSETGTFSTESYTTLLNNLADAFINVKSKGYVTSQEAEAVYALHVHQYLKDYGLSVSSETAATMAQALLSALLYPPLGDVAEQIDAYFRSLQ